MVWLPRQEQERFGKLCKKDHQGNYIQPNANYCQGNVKLLRPKDNDSDPLDRYVSSSPDCDEYFSVHRIKLTEGINTLVREHKGCTDANFAISNVVKKGVTARISFKCLNCPFVSRMLPMYTEVDRPGKRGAKQATVNVGLQSGLMETAIGNTKLRVLLSGGNMYSPAKSFLQNISNSASKKIIDMNKEDMTARLNDLKVIQEMRRVKLPNSINIAFDGRYDSVRFGARHKMGQSCSQGVGVARELVTDQQQVVGVSVLNKLCATGSYLRHKGFDAVCPNGHAGKCTATIGINETITEKKMALEIGAEFNSQRIAIEHMVTDGDSSSVPAMESATNKLLGPIKRQADTVHRGQTQIHYGQKAVYSKDFFPNDISRPNISTADMQKVFSIDIKNRTSLAVKSLFKKWNGNLTEIGKRLQPTVEGIVRCYAGDCTYCRYRETGCGGGKKNSWWVKSSHLPALNLTAGSLTFTDSDKKVVSALLELKLSTSALDEMKFQETTNSCEAFNRALSARLPKNVSYPRNAVGRVHATIHSVNNKLDSSVVKKCHRLGAPLGAKAVRTLKEISKHYNTRNKNKNVSRVLKKKNQVAGYMKAKMSDKGDYKKRGNEPDITDIVVREPQEADKRRHMQHDHSYGAHSKALRKQLQAKKPPRRVTTVTAVRLVRCFKGIFFKGIFIILFSFRSIDTYHSKIYIEGTENARYSSCWRFYISYVHYLHTAVPD